jgi:hypothetical protein
MECIKNDEDSAAGLTKLTVIRENTLRIPRISLRYIQATIGLIQFWYLVNKLLNRVILKKYNKKTEKLSRSNGYSLTFAR